MLNEAKTSVASRHSAFIIHNSTFLLVNDKSIGDGSVLFFRRIGVGSEGRALGSLDGFLAHRIVDDVCTLGSYFGTNDLSIAIDPNINYNSAFFAEVVIRTVQALSAAAT